MKKLMLGLFVSSSILLTSCADDDDNGNIINGQDEFKSYNLYSSTDASVAGSATITKNGDNTTTITVEKEGAASNENQVLHLHAGNAAETGDAVLTLEPFDDDGVSTTTFSAMDDGTEMNYQQLLIYDGYIDIHNANEMNHSMYADIGTNELTGESKTYEILAENNSGVEGTITFQKRVDNSTLATVNMINMTDTDEFSVSLYDDNSIDVGNATFEFNNMVGLITGAEITTMAQLDLLNDGNEITYNELIYYDGHVRFFQEFQGGTTGSVVATSDIGQNQLTGNTEIYILEALDGTDAGTFSLSERVNGETVVTVEMNGTSAGVNQAAFINSGIYGDPESLPTATLNLINGATGISRTNLSALDDGTEMDYDAWMDYDGHIIVLSTGDPTSSVAAHANMGMNAE